MRDHFRQAAVAAAIILASASQTATAGGAASSADKSQYTLFDPTPDDQLRDMDTDRPNASNTTHTIDAGHLQIETGFFDYASVRDRSPGADTDTKSLILSHFNVRLGVLNNLELNAALDTFYSLRTVDRIAHTSARQYGFGDMGLGAKLNLWGDDGGGDLWSTALSLQPQFSIPTAPTGLGTGYSKFLIGVPFQIVLPADFHLALQTAASRERNTANIGYITKWQNSASLDRTFGGFDIYLEYWSSVTSEAHQDPQSTLDVGFTYPLTPNMVLDAGANFGLTKNVSSLEILGGLSVRF